MSIPKKKKKKSLLKVSDINKEKELKVALTKGRDIGPYFSQKMAREIYQEYRKGGMPPKSAQRSMIRMLKKMMQGELDEHNYGGGKW
tara:strand:- start:1990 stop:2250 length:261 start_codon:yes stop_codon:yes gene_type:complete